MAQKRVAEADVAVRAFDQARHVAHGEAMEVRIFHDADLRVQRGEGIRRDLGPGAGNGGQQGGFAGVGITDQADLGHDAQLEQEVAFVARLARLGEARGLARGGGEVAVAQAAASAFAQDEALAVLGQVGDQLAFGLRAGGNRSASPSARERSISTARPLAGMRNKGRWLELARQRGSRRHGLTLVVVLGAALPGPVATPACRRGL